MIEFEHLITQSEVNSEYINLTATDGKQYGSQIAEHGKVLAVIDERGREFEMKKHHGNQLTRCSEWFGENAIKARTVILIRFDRLDGKLYLLPVPSVRPVQSQQLGSVSFTREGKHYELRCILDGSKVRVHGLLDGKQIGGFDF